MTIQAIAKFEDVWTNSVSFPYLVADVGHTLIRVLAWMNYTPKLISGLATQWRAHLRYCHLFNTVLALDALDYVMINDEVTRKCQRLTFRTDHPRRAPVHIWDTAEERRKNSFFLLSLKFGANLLFDSSLSLLLEIRERERDATRFWSRPGRKICRPGPSMERMREREREYETDKPTLMTLLIVMAGARIDRYAGKKWIPCLLYPTGRKNAFTRHTNTHYSCCGTDSH